MFKRRMMKRCDSILNSIMHDENVLSLWVTRVKDSFKCNDGNISNVYSEIAFTIQNDFFEKNKDVCMRVSVAFVTLVRSRINCYDDLDFKYHR